MSKFKTTESLFIEILLGVVLFIAIGFFVYSITHCNVSQSRITTETNLKKK